jgi:drug/metabolite transporter (DMT)-like permease
MEYEIQARRKRKIGYIYIIIASSCYAMIGIFGKLVLNSGFSAFELLFYQYVIMAAFLSGWILIKSPGDLHVSKKMLINLMIQGIIGAAGTSVLYYMALAKINVGMASMLFFTYPIFVNLFFIFTGIRKINLGSKIALAFAFIGSCLVLNIFTTGIAGISLAGIVLGILSSICYAFFNVFADLKLNTLKPITISFYTSMVTMIIGGILAPGALPHFAAATGLGSGAGPTPLLMAMLVYLAMLALICGVLPTILMYEGIARIGADKASILSSSELPLTILFAYLVLGEKMVLIQIVGIILIVAALLMLHRSDQGGNSHEIK